MRIYFKYYSRIGDTQGCAGPHSLTGPIPGISGAVSEPPNASKRVGTFLALRLWFGTKAVESRSQLNYSFTTLVLV